MLTLYHAPNSRSTSILALIEALGVRDRVDVVEVSVARADGSGGPDPRNPHPEGKVPFLVNGADSVRERGAIVAYLTELFPDAGLGRPAGHPQRGRFLGWLFYYAGVMEPVLVHRFAGIDHPALGATFRDFDAMVDRLVEALAEGPFLLGEDYSAVDLLLSSPFTAFPDAVPDHAAVRAWVARCADHPATRAVLQREAAG
ncbi:glutathione S-transferase family protein [Jannaschia sp. W003]|uniref:glutathione S-transferase family protein n=1 Tax=Jannaschia sp. W003 TaxID=2867012 RepID=UPI0021A375DB|nr:glutathione S-transferase N-terminal domain-containing protein [Jannaschia sp. W003]UWQ20025.1 glutathione S-transferase N-terminal domain-containing protein [Jannaschia sp. W003]